LLTTLIVKNFTLVEHLEVDFSHGMTALTGETGAGKSLMVDALAMALGDRADTDRIRNQSDRAEVAALFELHPAHPAIQWLEHHDFEFEKPADTPPEHSVTPHRECLLRRILTREGRSRGYINGQPATMQQLRELGETLIDIHSQHEHQSLLRRETHRKILDEFAGCDPLVRELEALYHQWRATQQQLQQLENDSDERTARKDLLSFQLSELDQLALEKDELGALEQQQQVLANAESILQDCQTLVQLCSADENFNIQTALNQAVQLLQRMPSKTASLEEAEQLLTSAQIEVEEAERAIQHHLDSFDADPEKLQQIEERLSIIYQLARKHKTSPEELYQKHQALNEELQKMTGGDNDTGVLQQQLDTLATRYTDLANQITKQRKAAALKLSTAIEQQFQALSMSGAKFLPTLTPLADSDFGPHGRETIEFMICTNPGEPAKPLSKIASGGELSRISLAIQVIAANHSTISTLVFDEVDVGIGGATADVVGKLLRQLGERGQVLCVTHQPQVAACAHHHYLASKSTQHNITHSNIDMLSTDDRTQEIARMLGGAQITDTTLTHAQEMLETASN
jgi:DNA repair protein RecN (Recombination protein N)